MTFRLPTIINVEELSDGTATVVNVTVDTDEFHFNGAGSSHRMPDDENDRELGHLLALKRALESIVTSLDAKTKRLITVNDKKRSEAENYKTLEQYQAEQEQARVAAMRRHPSSKYDNSYGSEYSLLRQLLGL